MLHTDLEKLEISTALLVYVSLFQLHHVRSGTLSDLTLSDLTVLLELFNAKLPLERYWLGLRPQEVEPGGGTIPNTTLAITTRLSPHLRWVAARINHLHILLIVKGKLTR